MKVVPTWKKFEKCCCRQSNKNSPGLQQLLTECSQYTGSTLFSSWSSCPEIVEILRRTLFLSDSTRRGFVSYSYPLNFPKNKSRCVNAGSCMGQRPHLITRPCELYRSVLKGNVTPAVGDNGLALWIIVFVASKCISQFVIGVTACLDLSGCLTACL